MLEQSGLVYRTIGRNGGTFVGRAKINHDLREFIAVPEYLARQGFRAGAWIVRTELVPCDEQVAQGLKLDAGEPVFHIHRIVFADDLPFSIEHGWVPADRLPGLLEKPLGGKVYDILKNDYGAVPAGAEETIEIAFATEAEAAQLDIPDATPPLLVTRVTVDAEDKPFEYSMDLFRGDRTTIKVTTPGAGTVDKQNRQPPGRSFKAL